MTEDIKTNTENFWIRRDKFLQNELAKAMLNEDKGLEIDIIARRSELLLCQIEHEKLVAKVIDDYEQQIDDLNLQHRDDLSRYDD
jgi:hypothetical protein